MDAPLFLYDVSSPYAYLAASRIGSLLPDARWRPVAFGFILRHTGRVPWSLGGASAAGKAEIAARARARGLPAVRYPEGWPRDSYSLLPLRALVAAEAHGALREMTLAAYRLAFAEGRRLDDPDAIAAAASAAGLDGALMLEKASAPEVRDRLRAYTEDAIARGVRGVPTVVVDDRLFWGDDRLEDAARAVSGA